ncbi:hypothetical protein QTO34_017123 [Cnephaeus nilssonii]|uniref:Uncharacterized protein n=1 Tax=Cnephaeus nilssonii TaxID=3371016 RepID=A0AA40I186_CNENI|nr:hypothetical protein QTO34_017123 [Eptesicus nilssonii]
MWLQVPRPGWGHHHHAGDSRAAHFGGSESAGGEGRSAVLKAAPTLRSSVQQTQQGVHAVPLGTERPAVVFRGRQACQQVLLGSSGRSNVTMKVVYRILDLLGLFRPAAILLLLSRPEPNSEAEGDLKPRNMAAAFPSGPCYKVSIIEDK